MGLVETAKDAFKIAQSLDNIELQRQILELQQEGFELIAENGRLKDELARLNKAMAISGELIVRENAYFRDSGGGQEDGPFCTCCWDVDRQLIRLHDYGGGGTMCPNCDKRGRASRGQITKMRRGERLP